MLEVRKMKKSKFHIMVNGLPGDMARLIFMRLLENPSYCLLDHSLTGPDSTRETFRLSTNLYKPPYHAKILSRISAEHEDNLIAIDFTQPSGIMENARLYCEYKIPFVMGTTGGDREALLAMVEASSISAVIAPNMSVPIVILMDMLNYAADLYPHSLQNWELRIVESHQAKKADVSGTAIAIGKIFNSMGVKYSDTNIRSIRDAVEQQIMGIPPGNIDGHGWHQYSLLSPDGSVQIGFEHNVNGRNTYVDGTILALAFLAKEIKEGSAGQCFSMQEVLRG